MNESVHTCICPNGHCWISSRPVSGGLHLVGISGEKCNACGLSPVTISETTYPWTAEKPTKPGWYRFKVEEGGEAALVQVTINGDGYLEATDPSAWIEGGDLVDTSMERWAGPLEPPV